MTRAVPPNPPSRVPRGVIACHLDTPPTNLGAERLDDRYVVAVPPRPLLARAPRGVIACHLDTPPTNLGAERLDDAREHGREVGVRVRRERDAKERRQLDVALRVAAGGGAAETKRTKQNPRRDETKREDGYVRRRG